MGGKMMHNAYIITLLIQDDFLQKQQQWQWHSPLTALLKHNPNI